MIELWIPSKDALESLIHEAKKVNLLKGVDIRHVSEESFPIRIPVNLEGFLRLAGNPLVKKMFGQKLETTVKSYLETVT